MAYEILSEIKKCEEKADEIRKKAVADAKKIISDAEKEALDTISGSKEKFNKKAQCLIDSAMTEVSDEISVICANTQKTIDLVKKTAQESFDKAVKSTVERIVAI